MPSTPTPRAVVISVISPSVPRSLFPFSLSSRASLYPAVSRVFAYFIIRAVVRRTNAARSTVRYQEEDIRESIRAENDDRADERGRDAAILLVVLLIIYPCLPPSFQLCSFFIALGMVIYHGAHASSFLTSRPPTRSSLYVLSPVFSKLNSLTARELGECGLISLLFSFFFSF